MTAHELAERITLDEVSEWGVMCGLEADEREERRKREDLQKRVSQGVTDARAQLRGRAQSRRKAG